MFNGKVLIGGFLILIGLSGLFNVFGFGDYWGLFWPVLVIFAGIYFYLKEKRTWGLFLIIAGVLFIIAELFNTSALSLIMPLFFIYIGASIFGVAPGFKGSNKGVNINKEEVDDFTLFGGSEKNINSDKFRGGEIVNVFSATKIYLTEATISKDDADLQISAIFGGAEVIVPKEMKVISRGTGVFGGWEDKTSKPENPKGGTLTIGGEAIFGGVVIRN